MQRFVSTVCCLVLAWGLWVPAWGDQIGLVLLHGKQDHPPFEIDYLARALRDQGFLVRTPEMPWSRNRLYAAGYEEAMKEIDQDVENLKKDGVQKVIVGGLSLGANAALGYAARRDNLSGLIVLAPGHFPEEQKLHHLTAASLSRAKEMIASGKGDQLDYFQDFNMGRSFSCRTTAKIYQSYFDPQGPAVIPVNAAAIRTPLPILWVVGSKDPLTRPSDYAFDKAPPHPQSRYVTVQAGHLDTPRVAVEEIIGWLKGLKNL